MIIDPSILEALCVILIPFSLWKIVEGLGELRQIAAASARDNGTEAVAHQVMMVAAPPMLESEIRLPDEAAQLPELTSESPPPLQLPASQFDVPDSTEALLLSMIDRMNFSGEEDDPSFWKLGTSIEAGCAQSPKTVNIRYSRIVFEKIFRFNEEQSLTPRMP